MRRALLGLGLLGACAAPVAPPVAPVTPPPAPPPSAPAITFTVERGVVTGRAGGGTRFRAKIDGAMRAVAAPDGGAFVLASGRVVRLDEGGGERWKAAVKRSGELLAAPGVVLVSSDTRVERLDAEDGANLGAIVADERGVGREAGASTPAWQAPIRVFPGAPGGFVDRRVAVSVEGVVLTSARDGSLVGLDVSGEPRFQLGVRGPVMGLEARAEGGFGVRTGEGVVRVDAAGNVTGEPAPRGRATLAYRAEPAAGERVPTLVLAPDDIWALAHEQEPVRRQRLFHFDGKAWREERVPALELMASPLFSGASELQAYALARGPEGQLLVIGLEQVWMKIAPAMHSVELRVLERVGKVFRERPDLTAAFSTTNQHIESSARAPEYALGPGGREVFCVVDECLARGLPAGFRPSPTAKPLAPSPSPGWLHGELPSGGMWWEPRPIVFAGEALWRLDAGGLFRDGQLVWEGPSEDEMDRELGRPSHAPGPLRALWASGPDDVWAVAGIFGHGALIARWDGAAMRRVASPLRRPDAVWGAGRDDVWISGDGAAHFDGKRWGRIPGVPGGPIVAGAKGDVWIGDWHVTPSRGALPDIEGAPAPAPPPAPGSKPLVVGAIDPSFTLARVSLEISGRPPMEGALGVAEGPGGVVWVHDRERLVEVVDGDRRGRALQMGRPGESLPCQRCAAPAGPGEGAWLTRGPDHTQAIRALSQGRAEDLIWLPDLLSLARAPDGTVWAVSAGDDDGSPRAVVLTKAGLRLVAGAPNAAYADVAPRAADDVWLAGGLSASRDGVRAWPEGEGVLVHFDGQRFTRHRGPDGALLSVAWVGPKEAWAVGMNGSLVRAKGDGVSAFYTARGGGERLGLTLRAVAATGPADVWLAGDGSTLLHWDGQALSRVDTALVGPDAALTTVVPPRAGKAGWVAGPRGIWRIERRAR